jgi:hypothetical protein
MCSHLFGIAFLAGAKVGSDILILPAPDHVPQQIPERKTSVEAGRVLAFHMFAHGVPVEDAKFERTGVSSFFPDRNPQTLYVIQRPVNSHEILPRRTRLGGLLGKIHVEIIARRSRPSGSRPTGPQKTWANNLLSLNIAVTILSQIINMIRLSMVYNFKPGVFLFNPFRGLWISTALWSAIITGSVFYWRYRHPPKAIEVPAPVAVEGALAPLPIQDLPDLTQGGQALNPARANNFKSMPMNIDGTQTFNCIFEGKATLHGLPCPHANVLVRASTKYTIQTKGTTTGEDGSYRLIVAVQAFPNDNLDWSIEAYTPDFNKLELAGRRIITEDDALSISQTLAFLPEITATPDSKR